jgi:hypothetical protein
VSGKNHPKIQHLPFIILKNKYKKPNNKHALSLIYILTPKN